MYSCTLTGYAFRQNDNRLFFVLFCFVFNLYTAQWKESLLVDNKAQETGLQERSHLTVLETRVKRMSPVSFAEFNAQVPPQKLIVSFVHTPCYPQTAPLRLPPQL